MDHMCANPQNPRVEVPALSVMVGTLGGDWVMRACPREWDQRPNEKKRKSLLCRSLHLSLQDTGRKLPSLNQEERSHQEPGHPGTLIMRCPALRTGRNECLLLRPLNLWHSVTTAGTKTSFQIEVRADGKTEVRERKYENTNHEPRENIRKTSTLYRTRKQRTLNKN